MASLTGLVFALFCMSTTGAESIPQTHTLTLDAALRAAEARSASLQGQQSAAQSYLERSVAASRLPDPELGLSITNLPVSGPDRYSLTRDFMTMRSLSLSQTWVDADKRRAHSERFLREADAATATLTQQQVLLRTQTARAWLDRYYQQQTLTLLTTQRDVALRVVEAAEAAYRGGKIPLADVFLARAAVARLDERLREARAQATNAEIELQRWVGDAAQQPPGPLPDITRSHLSADEADLPEHINQHPDIALLTAKEKVAAAEAEVARQEKRSDWTWSLMYSQRGPQYSDMVSFGVSIPLQWDRKNRRDRELAASLALADQARWEREEMQRAHLAKVRRLLTNWRSQLARLTDYDRSLIPLALERAQALESAFRGGKSGLSAVLDAQRMVLDSRLERLRLERDAALSWADLKFLLPSAPGAAPLMPAPSAENFAEESQP